MKHVTGLANSAGTRITSSAFLWLQSARSGVSDSEQTSTSAVSISFLKSYSRRRPRHKPLSSTKEVMRITQQIGATNLAELNSHHGPQPALTDYEKLRAADHRAPSLRSRSSSLSFACR